MGRCCPYSAAPHFQKSQPGEPPWSGACQLVWDRGKRILFLLFFFFLPCTSATRLTAGQSNPLQSGHVTGRLPALTLPWFSRNSLTLCCWSLASPAFSQQPSWPLNCCSFVVRRHSKLNTQQKESPTPWDTHLFFISLGRG